MHAIDHSNFTGYAQTVVETTKNAAGQATKRIGYTFGTDEITQTTVTYDSSGVQSPATSLTFGHDAHGSVRVLFDALGALSQAFTYAAYGELLAIHNGLAQAVGTVGASGLEAQALTNLLYNGESFDSRIGQLYLRARWYDVHRFTTLDPYSGNSSNPLSFNKFGFVHANPIHGVDPTGMFFGVSGVLAGIAVSSFQQGNKGAADTGALGFAGLTTRGIRVLQQLYKLYDNATDLYGIYETLHAFLDFDINDLNAIRADANQLKSYLAGTGVAASPGAARESSTLGSGGSAAGGVRAAFQSKLGIPKAKQSRVQQIRDKAETMGLLNRAQEIIGEYVTTWAARELLGYRKTTLETYHQNHPQGIDLLAKHTTTGSWGVFEAKGGTSRLGTAKYGPNGREVKQMSGYWINHWLDDTIDRNSSIASDWASLNSTRQLILPVAAVM